MDITLRADLEALFLNSEKFYKAVDSLVWKDDITYMEGTMTVCDEKGINPEDLIRLRLISPILRVKLQEEAMANGLLKPESTLPV